MKKCVHKNLTHELVSEVVNYCPKGCDGEVITDLEVFCEDCKKVIYEVHQGHEGCKYGRN